MYEFTMSVLKIFTNDSGSNAKKNTSQDILKSNAKKNTSQDMRRPQMFQKVEYGLPAKI